MTSVSTSRLLKRALCLFLAVSAFSVGTIRAQDGQLTTLVEKTKPAVVYIVGSNSKVVAIGSGFYVRSDIVVTNYHVIESLNSIFIRTASDKILSVRKVLGVDRVNDLALLQVEASPGKVSLLELMPSPPKQGERIAVIGNPEGLGWSVSDGIVASIRKESNKSVLQITAPISSGSSGSPVLNLAGQVVGVAVSQRTDGQNLNFAVAAQHVVDLINRTVGSADTVVASVPVAPSNTAGLTDLNISSPSGEKLGKEYYSKGLELIKNKDCKGAIPFFERATVVDGKSAESWFALGYCRHSVGNREAAADDYQQAIRIRPGFTDAHWNLALIYSELKKWKEAVEAFGVVIKLDASRADAYFRLSLAAYAIREYVKSIEALKSFLKLSPSNYSAYYNLGLSYYNNRNYAEASESFRRAKLFLPEGPVTGELKELPRMWGLSLNEQDRYAETIQVLAEEAKTTTSGSLLLVLANAYSGNQNAALAEETYKRAIALNPKDPNALLDLTWHYVKNSKETEAIAVNEQIRKLFPEDAEVLYRSATLSRELDRADEALESASKAVKLDPKKSRYRLELAYILQVKSDFAGANAEFNEALRLSTSNSGIFASMAYNFSYLRDGAGMVLMSQRYLREAGWKEDTSLFMVINAYFGNTMIGKNLEAERILSDCSLKCDTSAWPFPVVKYLKKEISSADLLQLAGANDTDKLTEAHFYIGYSLESAKRYEEALVHFEWVLANGNTGFTEYILSKVERDFVRGEIEKARTAKPSRPKTRRRASQ